MISNVRDTVDLLAEGNFGKAVYERLKWLLENFDVKTLDDIETYDLFTLDSEKDLEGFIIIEDNLSQNIEYIERSFIYQHGENENEITSHESFLHFVFVDQDLDTAKEYMIQEDWIQNEEYTKIILPHVENVYNEPWEKVYHERK